MADDLYGIIKETDTSLEFLKDNKGVVCKYPFQSAQRRADRLNRQARRRKTYVAYILGRFEREAKV